MEIRNLETKLATPLYKQLKERIEEQIANNVFPKSERIPSENELMQLFHVSRITVRKAIAELVSDGVLVKERGKGTYVCDKAMNVQVQKINRSFYEKCRLNQKEASSKLLKAALLPMPQEIAEFLEEEPGSLGVYTEMLRLADNVPVALDYVWYHIRFSYLLSENLESELYEIIRKRDGTQMNIAAGYLDIGLATAQEAELLKVKKGEPLLIERVNIVDNNGKPVHYGKMLIVGRRYRLYY